MTNEETLIALGLLATEAREATGFNRRETAAKIGLNEGTLHQFENAKLKRLPAKATMAQIEIYYGWRRGVIEDIWARRRSMFAEEITMALLAEPEPTGLPSAAHLSDADLMAELNFRLHMRGHG